MICVICKKEEADGIKTSYTKEVETVFCVHCRMKHFPKHMNRTQYRRYWLAFNDKWRKENKDV